MPVQILCTSVVIRNDALDRVLEGGAENFGSIAPNAMSYSDDRLSQASFMSPVNAEEFARSLELRGLQRDGEVPDFVVVHAHNRSIEPECDWLVLFEYEQRLIATLRGSDSRTVVAPAGPAGNNPGAVRHYTPEEVAEKLEFVERNGSIDTYRDKATGELVYHTRQTETADEVFARAFETVWELRRQPGMPVREGEEAATIRSSIEMLQSLVAKHPDVARIHLALGMAWYAVGSDEKAVRQLARAVELEPEHATMLRELAGVCLATGDFPQASRAATAAVAVSPDDVELLGNLAVIQLLSGEKGKAQTTIQHAIRLQPDDAVNSHLKSIIAEVKSGARPYPKTLEEVMRPSPPKAKSWLSRMLGR